jgi:hypothetical protein
MFIIEETDHNYLYISSVTDNKDTHDIYMKENELVEGAELKLDLETILYRVVEAQVEYPFYAVEEWFEVDIKSEIESNKFIYFNDEASLLEYVKKFVGTEPKYASIGDGSLFRIHLFTEDVQLASDEICYQHPALYYEPWGECLDIMLETQSLPPLDKWSSDITDDEEASKHNEYTGVHEDEACFLCSGYGNVKGDTCWGCNGSGLDSDTDEWLGGGDEEEYGKKTLTFSQTTNDIVAAINAQLLKEGKLGTAPFMLAYHSYDSYDITNECTPDDSIARFTISGLKHIFPLLKIELGESNTVVVEGKALEGWSSMYRGDNHIGYIEEIMLDIFILYQDDEEKIPKHLYDWYFNPKD